MSLKYHSRSLEEEKDITGINTFHNNIRKEFSEE